MYPFIVFVIAGQAGFGNYAGMYPFIVFDFSSLQVKPALGL